ncbi:hypothetical protein ABFY54_28775 [Priestia megaterium]|uniref:hypothetical protein n=1 Tax=Priestia megaterium TaxID=1404 RepID=UPI003D2BC72C
MTKHRYYEGQKVIITGNTNGHFHEIGEVVTLRSAHQVIHPEETYWQLASEWFFTDCDCVPYEEVSINED